MGRPIKYHTEEERIAANLKNREANKEKNAEYQRRIYQNLSPEDKEALLTRIKERNKVKRDAYKKLKEETLNSKSIQECDHCKNKSFMLVNHKILCDHCFKEHKKV